MIFESLHDIPYRTEQAVIINVGTRFVTTLALLSTIKRSGLPVLLIDCPYQNKSDDFEFFKILNSMYNFDLITLALKNHGDTLDYIFKNLNSDYILLVDSDLEILDNNIVPLMRKYIQYPDIFGTGFRHGGFNIKGGVDYEERKDGYYEERMWIPFVMLKVELIKLAIMDGKSFNIRTLYNIMPGKPKFSRKLLYSKHVLKFSYFRESDYKFFNWFKLVFHGKKPLIVLFDTGSDIYMYLRYQKRYFFAGVDAETNLDVEFVHHYNGITRKLLYFDPYNTGSIDCDYNKIKSRLLNEYQFDFEDFNSKFLKILS